jgi:acetolactate synthase-1/3 small subunit
MTPDIFEADTIAEAPREKTRHVISLLVDNHFGVLTRVSSLFARKGFNIDSLTVSATRDSNISRITVTTFADEQNLHQIISQTEKLVEVRKAVELDPESSIQRELLLVKLAIDDDLRDTVVDIADAYKAEIVDFAAESMTLEIVGKPGKIDAFLEAIERYRILEMCRTGATALEHGSSVLE